MGGGGERGERGDYCPHKKKEEEEAEEEVEQGLFSSSFVPEAPISERTYPLHCVSRFPQHNVHITILCT